MIKRFTYSDPPEIEIERNWIHTGVHQEAYLTCIVHAEPQANVRRATRSAIYRS